MLSKYPIETAAIGTILMHRSAVADPVVYIESGRVALGLKVEGSVGSALSHQVSMVQGPNWLDSASAALQAPSALDAVAQTEVQLRRVPLAQFQALLTPRESSLYTILLSIARAAYLQTELAVSRLSKDAQSRCAEWLLSHAQSATDGSVCVHLHQTKQAIAKEIGVVPETLSRVLASMRRQTLIDGKGAIITLRDIDRLNRLASSPGIALH